MRFIATTETLSYLSYHVDYLYFYVLLLFLTFSRLPMKWLPSFVKLFLIFVAGFALLLGAGVVEMSYLGNYQLSSIFGWLRLVGLLLIVVSPILMGLKFFARLDSKVKLSLTPTKSAPCAEWPR